MSFLELRASFSSNFASLFSIMIHNFSVLFHLYLFILWTKESRQNANFQTLTKFLLLFFRLQVSFLLNFATPVIVMTHNFSEIFLLKHCMFWTKAHQCTIFQTFECSNESSLNSLGQIRVYSSFALKFSVIKDNFSVFFSSNLICFGQNESF